MKELDINTNYYFSHDYHVRSDDNIRDLIAEHGMTGYGVYWCLIEQLFINTNVLRENYKTLSHELHVSIELVKSVVNDFQLFIVEDGFIKSSGVQKRLEKRLAKSEKARQSVSNRWNKNSGNTNVSKTNNGRNTKGKVKGKDKVKEKDKLNTYSLNGIENFDSPQNEKENPVFPEEKKQEPPKVAPKGSTGKGTVASENLVNMLHIRVKELNVDYGWSGVDGKHAKELIQKLSRSIRVRKKDETYKPTNEEIINKFNELIESLPPQSRWARGWKIATLNSDYSMITDEINKKHAESKKPVNANNSGRSKPSEFTGQFVPRDIEL